MSCSPQTLLFRYVGTLVCWLMLLDSNLRAEQPTLKLKPGDHICIIGNTLADRMQHDGWLETYLHTRFPEYDLVVRNLGFSADTLNVRLRSQWFGSPDEWLSGSAPCPNPGGLVSHIGVRANRFETTNTRADVVFAFFGYNESFAGAAGLPAFKNEFDAFVKHTLASKYNGKSAPRLVLFSPIATEGNRGRDLPDGRDNNARLEMYTKAMSEVAQANGVPFVDLFHPMLDVYAKSDVALTINGIHLTEKGNQLVAGVIDAKLFAGQPEPKRDAAKVEKLRQAVIDKNFHWFNRYRVMDGYNIYGGRAFEKYADQQSNYEDQQRELEILDTMTANREKRVWALAKGGDLVVDDSNAPPLIPVKTNKPGPLPGGKHVFVDGEAAIGMMKIAPNMHVNVFASEKDFPELAKPVQMQFDPQGRLWVAVWPSYPRWKPNEKRSDKILIFEDTKGTGKADKMTVFADELNCPTGFEFYNGGVLVAQAPDLLFLKDTKGTGKADVRVRVIHGLDSADSHHTSNSFALDPGGALYFQEGTFHHTSVETPYGPPLRVANGAVFRYEPRAQKFDVYVTHGFANPHGHVWDKWGQDIVIDGTGANPYHGALFSGHLDFPEKHNHPPQVYQQQSRPCPGVEILSSRMFPADMQGDLIVPNVIGFQGIFRQKLTDKGASFAGSNADPILSSTDPNFRPSDLKIGPDGAIWFLDWHNPIIGHLQHAIRDPSRDRTHGRIYRVTYGDAKVSPPVKIAGEPITHLLDLLKQPEDRVRYRARIELGGRDTREVIDAAKKWVAGLDPSDPEYQHHVLEALWLHQAHDVVDTSLLSQVLSSPDFRARAAAARVLCYWRDRVPEALQIVKKLAADVHPRVRLEAVRTASFFPNAEAVEVPLISTEHPSDTYLDFVRTETMRALDPYVKRAIAEGKPIEFTSAAGARYFLKNISTDDLLKMKRGRGVYLELLFRKGVRDEFRREALVGLGKIEGKTPLRVLIDAIRGQDEQQVGTEESVCYDLIRLMTDRAGELGAVRVDLEKLATSGRLALTRELGYVALIAADGNVDKAWALAARTVAGLRDLVEAMPLVRDPSQRAALFPLVEPLLDALPASLGSNGSSQGKTVTGRYVRVSLPGGQRTLTLAEVQVFSDGRNVARAGKASQHSTAHGGDAARGIDGNASGTYGDGGQTHTREGVTNPWWEVDLGSDLPIDSIVVWNRVDGELGNRLQGYTLEVLDSGRRVAFAVKNQPAPQPKAILAVSDAAPERVIRHAAMTALTSVRGQEARVFKDLARFLRDPADRPFAVQALLRIPSTQWPAEDARPVLNDLLTYIRKVPVSERTAPAPRDALQLADALAALLPRDDARAVRKELGELGVRVVRLATVPDQMRYDLERIVVRAGRPVEVQFENTDLMPHNFVITQMGALEEIGTQAEAAATKPGALERHYVPQSSKVLVSSKLLAPRDSQRLAFNAPAKPGIYPYVCTYPGHWRRMYGALYVVADLDDYLADPEGYLAANALPIEDALLKDNRPRKEWKLEDLSASAQKLEGRSYANGKQLFQVASCVACHKFDGVGVEMGPDLTKLDPKQQAPLEILHDILEPSFRINEKYVTQIIETNAGKTITGLVLEENADVVKMIENPLVKADPIVIRKSDIADRKKSPTSIMPKGLLDKLTRDEVLDLLAYVASRADPKHPAFQGGHEHQHEH